jgi:PAS domain S-box-containing protein
VTSREDHAPPSVRTWESEAHAADVFRTAIEASYTAIVVTRPELNRPGPLIEYVNPAFTRMTGYAAEEVVGKCPRLPQGPETSRAELARMRSDLERNGVFEGEAINYRKDGSTYHVEWLITAVRDPQGRIERWVSVQREVTRQREAEDALRQLNADLERRVEERTAALRQEMAQRREAESRLSQAERLDALGRLTGGVAHDINNKLQVITAHVDRVAARLRQQPQDREPLVAALVAADRASDLIAQLLAFASQQGTRAEVVDVAAGLQSVAGMLDGMLSEAGIEVVFSVADDLWPVEANANQLESVVLNLVLNARDAMPAGGRVEIKASNVSARETAPRADDWVGGVVQISVRDTGEGIAPGILSRVFEPFFTTKAPGKGTGLRLSQAYGFAKQYGGTVAVESTVGEGTLVTLDLPRAAHEAEVRTERGQARHLDRVSGATGCRDLLVVDDDPDVGQAIAAMLLEAGHTVRVASGGREALEMIGERAPALILSDLTMPGMSGLALIHAVRREHPGLAVVLVTGNPEARQGRMHPSS